MTAQRVRDAGELHRTRQRIEEELGVFMLQESAVEPDAGDLPRRAIRGVVDAAEQGHLPLFAATVGLSLDEFSARLGDSPAALVWPMLYSDLLASWMPSSFPELVSLLWEHRSGDERVDWPLAHAVACACFGHRHLWQDLGLERRQDASRLLMEHFFPLSRENVANSKWKRFFFRKLGERLGVPDLAPRGCVGCAEFGRCFVGRPARDRHEIMHEAPAVAPGRPSVQCGPA